MSVVPTSMINPETGIPDLVRRLTDDSKRLAADELRLAKLEARESIHTAARGATWIGLALGVSIVALVALTVALVAMSGVFVGANYWLGALVVGAVEVAVGWWLVRRGLSQRSAND